MSRKMEAIAPPAPVVHARKRPAGVWGTATTLVAAAGLTAGLLVARPWSHETPTSPAPAIAQAVESNPWRVAVTGTGPGLIWLADRQAGWSHQVVTGTGPALVHLATLQSGSPGASITGTGPGLVTVAERAEKVALVGTP